MRIAVDTNVLGYAEGLDDFRRRMQANNVLEKIGPHNLVMPLQVAAELHRLILRRRRMEAAQAEACVARWMSLLPHLPETTATTFDLALSLSRDHHLQIFNAIILAASAEAECRLLLSEDMGDGFVWRGVTVVDPFADTPHPLLADALRA